MINYESLSFDTDPLCRGQFAKSLTQLIKNGNSFSGDDSLSIAIDSSWGTGKTYFMHMWENWINSEDFIRETGLQCRVIYYNAWENDDCKNALSPLIYSIVDEFDNNDKIKEGIKSASFEAAKKILNSVIKNKLGVDISDVINAAEKGYKEKKDYFDQYKSIINAKKRFKDEIEDIADANGRLIVFVDELDRCRPLFAIETLETIKHYFNVPKISFVFALDMQQLSYSIATVYGHNMDSSGYLRRFFNYVAKVPAPTINSYLKFKLNGCDDLNEYYAIIHNLFSYFDLTLRDIDIILNNFKLLYFTYREFIDTKLDKQVKLETMDLYLYFLIMKYKFPNVYDILLHQKYHYEDSALRVQPWFTKVDSKFIKVDDPSKAIEKYHQWATQHFPCQSNFEISPNYISPSLKLDNDTSEITVSQYIEKKLEFFDTQISM